MYVKLITSFGEAWMSLRVDIDSDPIKVSTIMGILDYTDNTYSGDLETPSLISDDL